MLSSATCILKAKNSSKWLPILAVAVLTACGGGSDDDTVQGGNLPPQNPPSPPISIISGGDVSNPVLLNVSQKHEIKTNSHYNYYWFPIKKGEKLITHSMLSTPLNDQEKGRCNASPTDRGTHIYIYDQNVNPVHAHCGEGMTFTAQEDGNHLMHWNFPYKAPGYFQVAMINGDSAISTPQGEIGTPSAPRELSLTSGNVLVNDRFHNYYKTTLTAGQKLLITTRLNQPLTDIQKGRCASSGSEMTPSSYDTQINVYNSFYERVGGICGENYTFTPSNTGTYIFHFAFNDHSAGIFYASAP